MGPAGSGKSTFCTTILSHFQSTSRSAHLVNLDPAAESFTYTPKIDIRDLISVQDVMDELHLGPNGGLIYCLEFLINNHSEWLEEELGSYEEDYLIIDCPGQIELYTHVPIMKRLVTILQKAGYAVVGIYALDSQFMEDVTKFFSGVLSAMSAMIQLEIPHINVLTKMDLLQSSTDGVTKYGDDENEYSRLRRFLDPDPTLLLEESASITRPKFAALNEALVRLIDEYNMVSFLPLNIKDEESIELLLMHIDHAVQYGEDLEPKDPKDFDEGENGDDEIESY